MIELGNTLKAAREAKGLSIADIANRTHMMSSMVADLENDDFSRLPAPIYGRGFIKLYCEVVGIDPTLLVAEFNEICAGNREPAIRERTVPPTDARTDASATPTPSEPPPPAQRAVARPDPVAAPEPPTREQLDLFSSSSPATHSTSAPAAEPPTPQPQESEPSDRTGTGVFARYASPLRDHAASLPRMAPAVGRWCVVALVLTLVVCGIAVGIRALYRATGTATPEPQADPAVRVPVRTTPTTAVRTDRQPIDVPPLYID